MGAQHIIKPTLSTFVITRFRVQLVSATHAVRAAGRLTVLEVVTT